MNGDVLIKMGCMLTILVFVGLPLLFVVLTFIGALFGLGS